LFATLHLHEINGITLVRDCKNFVEIPPGWFIAPDGPNIRRIISEHKWQSSVLVLDDGSAFVTKCDSIAVREYPKSHQLPLIVRQGTKVSGRFDDVDILLMKRA
jgi:hypothetical protein